MVFVLSVVQVFSQRLNDERLTNIDLQLPLGEILDNIQNRISYSFSYDPENLPVQKIVTLKYREVGLEDLLLDVSQQADVIFRRINNQIAVRKKVSREAQEAPVIEEAKDRYISGFVTNESDESLPGANVLIEGSSIGTITDINGYFELWLLDNKPVIVSHVGYQPVRIVPDHQSKFNLVLKPDPMSLSEVVVVGYGEQDLKDVSTAISSLKFSEVENIATSDLTSTLQGQLAGVDIIKGFGRPGENVSIQIRGNRSISAGGEPLFVLDGIPLTDGALNSVEINPFDVESIEVLKDAVATSIYGSRGSNGVVLISTKRGFYSEKPTFKYNTYHGVSRPLQHIDVMTGEEFADLKREAYRDLSTGIIPPDSLIFEPVELASIRLNRSTDYQKLVLDPGVQSKHEVSLGGGNRNTKYFLSLSRYFERAIIPDQSFERYSSRINLNHRINRFFELGSSNLISYSIQNLGSNQLWNETLNNNPLGVPYDENGNLIFLPTSDGIRTNPLSELVEGAIKNEKRSIRVFTNMFATAQLSKALQYKLRFGGDLRYSRAGEFLGSQTQENRGGPSLASVTNFNRVNLVLENILTYHETFNSFHEVKVTLLQSGQRQRAEQYFLAGAGLPYEDQLFYNLGSASIPRNSGSNLTEWSLASFMGRINYSVKDKYLFQLTSRYDGSSRLAPENKWRLFPGVSFGWMLSNEGFMSKVDFLSSLKLRWSYGSVGNTSISPYSTQSILSKTLYAWDEESAIGYRLTQLGNKDLQWEVSTTSNVGLDFGLYENRLTGSLEVFKTKTDNILLERAIPMTSGYGSVLQNIGKTENTGLEFSLNGLIVDQKDMKWMSGFNISTYTEEIVELSLKDSLGQAVDDIGNSWFIGEPINVFYDYEKIGIWQSGEEEEAMEMEGKVPGEIRLKDLDHDGKITPADRSIQGSTVPLFFGGLSNSIEFGGFDLSFYVYFKVGHTIQSSFHYQNSQLDGRFNNLDVDYWTVDNPTNAAPRPNKNQSFPKNGTSMTYFDGSYVKLKNVTFGYSFPKKMVERIRMNSFRVYIAAQDLWFFTRYDTYDPESSYPSVSVSSNPASQLFLVGLNVEF